MLNILCCPAMPAPAGAPFCCLCQISRCAVLFFTLQGLCFPSQPQEEEEEELRKVRGSRCRQRGVALWGSAHSLLFSWCCRELFWEGILPSVMGGAGGSRVCPCRALPCSPGEGMSWGRTGICLEREGLSPSGSAGDGCVSALTKESQAVELCPKRVL